MTWQRFLQNFADELNFYWHWKGHLAKITTVSYQTPQIAYFDMTDGQVSFVPPPTICSQNCVFPFIRLAVHLLTLVSHDTISLYLVERFQWNLPQIFIMWVGTDEKVYKVRGQRSWSWPDKGMWGSFVEEFKFPTPSLVLLPGARTYIAKFPMSLFP